MSSNSVSDAAPSSMTGQFAHSEVEPLPCELDRDISILHVHRDVLHLEEIIGELRFQHGERCERTYRSHRER